MNHITLNIILTKNIMKKILIIDSFIILTFGVTLAFAISQSQYNYWNIQLSSQPINQIAKTATIVSTNVFEWPKIVSTQYKSQLNSQAKQLNTNFRNLSQLLLEKLDEYHNEIESSTDEQFIEKITPIIELRNKIAINPTYVNYTLVDHINRILIVNTAERLVKSIPLPTGIEEIVSNVCTFTIEVDVIKKIFEKENDKNYNLNIINLPQKSKYEKLWYEIEPETDFMLPKNCGSAISYKMINSENIELVSWRMMVTAPYKASLPYMLEYRRKSTNYSSEDSYQKICLLMSDKNLPSLPIFIKSFGNFSPASFVLRTMHYVRTDKIKGILDFNIKARQKKAMQQLL